MLTKLTNAYWTDVVQRANTLFQSPPSGCSPIAIVPLPGPLSKWSQLAVHNIQDKLIQVNSTNSFTALSVRWSKGTIDQLNTAIALGWKVCTGTWCDSSYLTYWEKHASTLEVSYTIHTTPGVPGSTIYTVDCTVSGQTEITNVKDAQIQFTLYRKPKGSDTESYAITFTFTIPVDGVVSKTWTDAAFGDEFSIYDGQFDYGIRDEWYRTNAAYCWNVCCKDATQAANLSQYLSGLKTRASLVTTYGETQVEAWESLTVSAGLIWQRVHETQIFYLWRWIQISSGNTVNSGFELGSTSAVVDTFGNVTSGIPWGDGMGTPVLTLDADLVPPIVVSTFVDPTYGSCRKEYYHQYNLTYPSCNTVIPAGFYCA